MLSQNKLKVVGKVKVSGASSREERSVGMAGGGMGGTVCRSLRDIHPPAVLHPNGSPRHSLDGGLCLNVRRPWH